MADNIAITAGAGTTVATDDLTDAGGAHVQFVKLMDGAANSAAKIGGDAANGLDVDVTRLPALVAGAAIIGSLAANQSTNQAQVAGTATSVNNGTVDAGTQRVTLASNSTGQVALATGANTIGALTANQSVNTAQVAGVALSTGSRITDTGVQSVFQAAPATANILVGHQAQTATTAATTIITVPINRTWVGTIVVTCDVANTAVTGTTAGQALGTITTVGTSVTPAAATVATCEARVGANTATIGGGAGASNSISVPMVVSAGASALATIALASTQAGTNSRVAAICSGYLI